MSQRYLMEEVGGGVVLAIVCVRIIEQERASEKKDNETKRYTEKDSKSIQGNRRQREISLPILLVMRCSKM